MACVRALWQGVVVSQHALCLLGHTSSAQGDASASGLRNPGVVVDNRKSVLMRNLPFKSGDEDIVAFFAGVGTVVDIRRGQHDGRLFDHVHGSGVDRSLDICLCVDGS